MLWAHTNTLLHSCANRPDSLNIAFEFLHAAHIGTVTCACTCPALKNSLLASRVSPCKRKGCFLTSERTKSTLLDVEKK